MGWNSEKSNARDQKIQDGVVDPIPKHLVIV